MGVAVRMGVPIAPRYVRPRAWSVQADSDVAWRRCHPDQHVRGDRDSRFRLDAALSA
jgi:hypothetical protein